MDRRFFIWNKGEGLAIAPVKVLPNSFTFNGDIYHELDEYFADFDHLRDHEGRLIGFSFITDGGEAIYSSELLECDSVVIDGFQIMLLLAQQKEFEIETVQGMGTRVFRTGKKVVLEIPDWGAEPLGFSFDKAEIASINDQPSPP